MSTEKRPPGVMLYFTETRPILALMTDAERMQILEVVLDYAEYDVAPGLSARLSAVWPFFQQMVDRDMETYRKKCEKAAKVASARWEKKVEGD
ncbi:DUF6291 domain-containing protein [uncultured Oscillibacter sp.]|uniref:DUF6291 domain-containing protein n=1 Tax=uncultured Oscillibacter sp. TaxID=876091 RepID=UPI002624F598|nr:DUF6291 domain-containing protein [uncultured Oscillibacter sp.]